MPAGLLYGVFWRHAAQSRTRRYFAPTSRGDRYAANAATRNPENEVRFLLGSEQIRDSAPYNAILAAIAGAETKFNGIHQLIGVEGGAVSGSLRTLLEQGWIRREFPFGESSERRALWRVVDPFLTFWYRFIGPLASTLQLSDPATVYAAQVASRLPEYMGWSVFEEICGQ